MPLSGIFRIFTPSIKRMTMFKKTDPNPQLDIFTVPSMLLGSRTSNMPLFKVAQVSFL